MFLQSGSLSAPSPDPLEQLDKLDYYGQRPWRQGHQSKQWMHLMIMMTTTVTMMFIYFRMINLFLPLSENLWMKKGWIIWCYRTLMNSQVHVYTYLMRLGLWTVLNHGTWALVADEICHSSENVVCLFVGLFILTNLEMYHKNIYHPGIDPPDLLKEKDGIHALQLRELGVDHSVSNTGILYTYLLTAR